MVDLTRQIVAADPDPKLYTMWELTQGGRCRQVPQRQGSRRPGGWIFGQACSYYIHRSCMLAHACTLARGRSLECVLGSCHIWRLSQGPARRRARSMQWRMFTAGELQDILGHHGPTAGELYRHTSQLGLLA